MPVKRRTIAALGLSQLVCWGISFYLIGVFGERMLDDLGWSRALIYGGYSVALLVMGLVSPLVGRAIDRLGGGPVMTFGSVLCGVSCLILARAETIAAFYSAWIILGIAMRSFLYDAAFAALVRIAGPAARRPISQITLLGGLAAPCFWPIGLFLTETFGWRGALDLYAVIALATIALHVTLPRERYQSAAESNGAPSQPQAARVIGNSSLMAFLYALIIALGNGLNAGMSAHLIGILSGLGFGAAAAVSIASLRGIGQSGARLIDVMLGSGLHPVTLNLLAATAMPLCFALGLISGDNMTGAVAFALGYGAATGILTITRGTLPLVLFDHATYGTFVGKLLVPSFLVSAAAPLVFAIVIDEFGAVGALTLCVLIGLLILAAALTLGLMRREPA